MKLAYSNRFDRWFYGCSNFPKCRGSVGLNELGEPMVRDDNEIKRLRVELYEILVRKFGDDKKSSGDWLENRFKSRFITDLDRNELKTAIKISKKHLCI